jgi:hypothetical protein
MEMAVGEVRGQEMGVEAHPARKTEMGALASN